MNSQRTSMLLALLVAAGWMPAEVTAEEPLFNGIRLSSSWPPEYRDLTRDEPMMVPYLTSPPKVIPIDVGRQLFVDNFLIETTLRWLGKVPGP